MVATGPSVRSVEEYSGCVDNNPPRYRDYLVNADSVVTRGPEEHQLARRDSYPQVIVNQNRFDGTWSAIHETDEGIADELDSAGQAEAVAWAHARCSKVLVFDPGTGEFVVSTPAE